MIESFDRLFIDASLIKLIHNTDRCLNSKGQLDK